MKSKILLQILVLMIFLQIHAIDLPKIKLDEAVKKYKYIFAGRVIATEEIQIQEAKILSKAKIRIIKSFIGTKWIEKEEIYIKYYSDSIDSRSLPVHFKVSEEILFFIQTPILKNEFLFDSNIEEGIDFAYFINNNQPYYYFPNTLQSEAQEISFHPICAGQASYWLKRSDFEKLIKQRRAIEKRTVER